MAKRLRGWQLEMESGISKQAKASKALEKAEGLPESNLANKLLFLWARGSSVQLWSGSWLIVPFKMVQSMKIWLQLHRLAIGELSQGMCTGSWWTTSAPMWKLLRALMYGFPAPILRQTRMLWKRHPFFYLTWCLLHWAKITQKCFPNFLALEKAQWQASGKKLPNQAMLS